MELLLFGIAATALMAGYEGVAIMALLAMVIAA
jgi:hypothetical protein